MWPVAALTVLLVCALAPMAEAKSRQPVFDRPTDPVVMTGAELPRLLGSAPDRVVAFRFKLDHHSHKKKGHARAASTKPRRSSAGRWIRVPVQVDERAVVDFGAVPSGSPPSGDHTVYGTPPVGATALQYTDPNTFVGPDPDPTLDPDDEVAFMAADAGFRAVKAKRPRHTLRGGATRVLVQDPLTSAKRWIYLFRAGARIPSLPTNYVTYDFKLLSGDYKQTYDRASGPNPEASTIVTSGYQASFSDRWFFDSLHIDAGGASAVDILDGYKFAFAPGSCTRSEATFNAGEGAFVANKDGPVRAIRSYVGANSGPYTERTDLFYANRHDIVTDLRVHPIPSLFTQYDMSQAAIGMTYSDEQHQGGVPVDGNPDTLPGTTPSSWHLWQGPQGSFFVDDQVHSTFADAFLSNAQAFYQDDSTPSATQCWGDSQQIGSAGLSSNAGSGIPATYPGAPDTLQAVSSNLMLAPGVYSRRAALLHQALLHQMLVRAGVFGHPPRPRR
jgi:hypothetical protein